MQHAGSALGLRMNGCDKEMLSGLREDVCGVGVGELCSFSVLMQPAARKAKVLTLQIWVSY